jgi:hypothetical protein
VPDITREIVVRHPFRFQSSNLAHIGFGSHNVTFASLVNDDCVFSEAVAGFFSCFSSGLALSKPAKATTIISNRIDPSPL